MKKKISVLIVAFVLVFALSIFASADFGSYSGDYDFDYDYGWDSGSDWDSDDDWNWDSDDDDDYDWGNSGTYVPGYIGSASDVDVPDAISVPLGALIFFGIIGLVIFSNIRKKRGAKQVTYSKPQQFTAPTLRSMNEYLTIDPNFSGEALRERCSNLYVQMQNCWTQKDIEPLRPYFTDAFFSQMERQLDSMRASHRTNYVENISVVGVQLMGFDQAGGMDHIYARLITRIVDYTLDDETGELVSGDRTRQKHIVYEWDLSRQTGQLTTEESGTKAIYCPNCGAPLDINASARCPYCDSVIQQAANDWALCGIRALSQQTN